MKNHQMDEIIEQALQSADGAGRATPKPFLLTRMMARMNRVKENRWDVLIGFVTRPSVVIVTVSVIIIMNTLAIVSHSSSVSAKANSDLGVADDYSTTALANLYNIEN